MIDFCKRSNYILKLVDAQALADLFELFSDQLECVVLNACYSKVQAREIAKKINYLPEFEDEQVQKLAFRYGLNWSLTQVQQLKEQIGGHPYLVHEAIKNLKMNPELTLTNLLEKAATDEGIYAQHLQHHWSTLEQEPNLVRQLKTIVEADKPIAIAPN